MAGAGMGAREKMISTALLCTGPTLRTSITKAMACGYPSVHPASAGNTAGVFPLGLPASAGLTNKLAVDLEDVADCRERIKEIIQAGDEHPQTRSAMLRAVSLPGNAGALRDLTTAYQRLVAIERQAFGLDDNGPQAPPPFEDTLTPEKRRALEAAAIALGKEVSKDIYQ